MRQSENTVARVDAAVTFSILALPLLTFQPEKTEPFDGVAFMSIAMPARAAIEP
jgi:hypothetical protein